MRSEGYTARAGALIRLDFTHCRFFIIRNTSIHSIIYYSRQISLSLFFFSLFLSQALLSRRARSLLSPCFLTRFRLGCRVLKPPGGGSSDIFGAAPDETSPRRVKAHNNQSQLGSALFGDANGTDGTGTGGGGGSNAGGNGNAAVSPRSSSKPGNDSYKRLFGPPDAPPITPNARNHMRSNIIPLSGGTSSVSSLSSGAATSPAKSTASSGSSNSRPGVANGFAASNGSNWTNDITGKGRSRAPRCRAEEAPPAVPSSQGGSRGPNYCD